MTHPKRHTLDVQGVRIPKLGFGTWQLQGDTGRAAVEAALEVGYRHIDTAQAYENEGEVGAALRASRLPRDDFFLTTKVWRDNAKPDDVRRSTHESLTRLGVDHVDLLLLHWPVEDVPLEDTLGAMLALQEEGLTRRIGVSNFTPSLLERARELAPIAANQVEHHPYLGQTELRRLAQAYEIALTAYCPLAQNQVADDATLTRLAKRYDTTPQVVTLRWLLEQPHVVAIPRSSSPEHIAKNFEALSLEMEDAAFREIDELDRGERLIDPSFAPDWER